MMTRGMLRMGGEAMFFETGLSYHEVLWTEPKGGNAYFILARQFIAAELNVLKGASIPSEILDAWNKASDLLIKYQEELVIPKGSTDR